MGTQLILTVGTNALPIWAAWHNLKKKLSDPVSVQFVYTADTPDAEGSEDQKNLLERYCRAGGATVLPAIDVDANQPNRDYICDKIIAARSNNCTDDIHVHYTGGTQAMGVATISAMGKATAQLERNGIRGHNIDASYLDPGRSSAPNIVNWSGNILEPDTRVSVDADAFGSSANATITNVGQVSAGPDAVIRKVADLNGFKVAHFTSTHPPGGDIPSPKIPTDAELCAGTTFLEHVGSFDQGVGRNGLTIDLKDQWNCIFRRNNRFIYPTNGNTFTVPSPTNNGIWRNTMLPPLDKAYPTGWDLGTGNLMYPGRSTVNAQQKIAIEKTHDFLNGHWLEYAAYAAFKQALEEIRCNSNGSRSNYELFHNVYVRPSDSDQEDPHFELDVVAVLGYQVVVVSCSVIGGRGARQRIKLKAMEAYHRAKQLGGDEARAIVICVDTANIVRGIQKELADETGTKQPLRIWGRTNAGRMPNLQSLRTKFENLLNDLHWN